MAGIAVENYLEEASWNTNPVSADSVYARVEQRAGHDVNVVKAFCPSSDVVFEMLPDASIHD
jgi:hypothetical protein